MDNLLLPAGRTQIYQLSIRLRISMERLKNGNLSKIEANVILNEIALINVDDDNDKLRRVYRPIVDKLVDRRINEIWR